MSDEPKKIVALVDGSVYSASVCQYAAWLSGRTSAPVELIHVLGRREVAATDDHSGAIALGARSALLEKLASLDAERAKLIGQRGRAVLDDARQIVEQAGLSDITTRLRHGDLLETVAAAEPDARAIIIGKRGEAADFAKGHLGSNLERIVRATRKPVLVASRSFRAVSKVLVAYDGGESARKVLDHIATSPTFKGLSLHLVTVGSENADVKAALTEAAAALKAAGLEAETLIVPGQPETALAKLVDEAGYDMLMMGAYGHSRIRSLIIGSTTTAMIRSCKVPVVLMR
ncbi:universal stress protein [Paracoccus albus]|uniref:universal stress protein n=1 Tax=Paracoccus albus TaxID=3017784 RepID=UPI0022F048F1|nr:universal stress protein [Paracoccus albus]WBU61007.1 universal stress protein [Paracoccus albus]